MNKLIELLQGKKTYIIAGIGAIIVFLRLINAINDEVFGMLLSAIGLGGVASLRAAIKK